MEPEGKEATIPQRKIEDFTSGYVEFGRDSVQVDANIVAAESWKELVSETQEDGRERGVVISRDKNGETLKSPIFIGHGEEFDEETGRKISSGSIVHPYLPHGLKNQLRLRPKGVVFVHSHPMPEKINHIYTMHFSDLDIERFLLEKFNAFVAVDRGGAHLLVRTKNPYLASFVNKHTENVNIVSQTIDTVTKEKGTSLDIVKKLSAELPRRYGLAYYFTPSLEADTQGYVKFLNPRNINENQLSKNLNNLSSDQ